METNKKLRWLIPSLVILSLAVVTIIWYIRDHSESNNHRETILSTLSDPGEFTGDGEPLHNAVSGAYRQIREGEDPVTGLARLARIYQANGYLNEAIQSLDLLLQLDPENPRWPHLLAFILAGYGELDPALELWQTTIELEPDYLPAHLRRAEALLKLNRFEEAKDAFMIVQTRDADNPHAFHGLARIAISRGDYQSAHQLLLQSMEHSDGSVGIQLFVTVLEQIGQKDRADAVRGMAKTLEGYSDIPDPWIHELMDYCYDPRQLVTGAGFAVYAGDADRGIALTRRAIEYDPDYAYAYFQLGVIYRQKGQPEMALNNFKKASDMDPRLSDAWLRRAEIHLEMGSVEKGKELLALGLVHNADSPALNLAWGELLLKQSRPAEAVPSLKRSIELRPQEPEAYLALSRAFIMQGDLEQARASVLGALEAEAANPVALNMAAIIDITLGNKEAALKWIRKLENQPRNTREIRQKLHHHFENAFGHAPQ